MDFDLLSRCFSSGVAIWLHRTEISPTITEGAACKLDRKKNECYSFLTMRILAISALFLVLLGCGGGSDVSPSAPQIVNLKVEPQTICVGTTATISFTLIDANDDEIIWGAGLSSGEHGGVNPSIGNVPSGTTVHTSFDAASSGRHNHQVLLKIVATDIGGLKGESSEIEFFVFNC
jgi:hypothetical protein